MVHVLGGEWQAASTAVECGELERSLARAVENVGVVAGVHAQGACALVTRQDQQVGDRAIQRDLTSTQERRPLVWLTDA